MVVPPHSAGFLKCLYSFRPPDGSVSIMITLRTGCNYVWKRCRHFFFLTVSLSVEAHLTSQSTDRVLLQVRVFDRVNRPKLEANNSHPSHTVVTAPINVGFELQILPKMEILLIHTHSHPRRATEPAAREYLNVRALCHRYCETRGNMTQSRTKRNVLHTIKRRKANWIGHILREPAF